MQQLTGNTVPNLPPPLQSGVPLPGVVNGNGVPQVQGGYIPSPQPQAPTQPQSRPTAAGGAGKQMKQYNSPQPLYSQVDDALDMIQRGSFLHHLLPTGQH